jgi:hypothetical protein
VPKGQPNKGARVVLRNQILGLKFRPDVIPEAVGAMAAEASSWVGLRLSGGRYRVTARPG